MPYDDYQDPEGPTTRPTTSVQDRVSFALEQASRVRSAQDMVPTVTQDADPKKKTMVEARAAYTRWADPGRSVENLKDAATRREARKEYLDAFSAQDPVTRQKDLPTFEKNFEAMNYAWNASQLLNQVKDSSAIMSGAIHGALDVFNVGEGLVASADQAYNAKLKYLGLDGQEHNAENQPKTLGDAITQAGLMIEHLDAADLGSLVSDDMRRKVKQYHTTLGISANVRGIGELMAVQKGFGMVSKGLGKVERGLRTSGAEIAAEQKFAAEVAKAEKAGTAPPAEPPLKDIIGRASKAPPTFGSQVAKAGEAVTGFFGGRYGGKTGATYGSFMGHGVVSKGLQANKAYSEALLANANNGKRPDESDQEFTDRITGTLAGRAWATAGGAVKGGLEGLIPATGFALAGKMASSLGRRWAPGQLPKDFAAGVAALDIEKGSIGLRLRRASAKSPFANDFVHNATEFFAGEKISEFFGQMLLGEQPEVFKHSDDLLTHIATTGVFALAFASKGAWSRARAGRAAKIPAGIAVGDHDHFRDVREITEAIGVPEFKDAVDKALSQGFPVKEMRDFLKATEEGGAVAKSALENFGPRLIEWRKANPSTGAPMPTPGATAPTPVVAPEEPTGPPAGESQYKDRRFLDRVLAATGRQDVAATPETQTEFNRLLEAAKGTYEQALEAGTEPETVKAGDTLRELYNQDTPLTQAQHATLLGALETMQAGLGPQARLARHETLEKTRSVRELKSQQQKLLDQADVARATAKFDEAKNLVAQARAIDQQIKDIGTPPKAGAVTPPKAVSKPGKPSAAAPTTVTAPAAGVTAAQAKPAKQPAAVVKEEKSKHDVAAAASLKDIGVSHPGARKALAAAAERSGESVDDILTAVGQHAFDKSQESLEELSGGEIEKYIGKLYPEGKAKAAEAAAEPAPVAAPAEAAPPAEAAAPAEKKKRPPARPKVYKAEHIGDVIELMPEGEWTGEDAEGQAETYTKAEFESYDPFKQHRAMLAAKQMADEALVAARTEAKGAGEGEYKAKESARVLAEQKFSALKSAVTYGKHKVKRPTAAQETARAAATAPEKKGPETEEEFQARLGKARAEAQAKVEAEFPIPKEEAAAPAPAPAEAKAEAPPAEPAAEEIDPDISRLQEYAADEYGQDLSVEDAQHALDMGEGKLSAAKDVVDQMASGEAPPAEEWEPGMEPEEEAPPAPAPTKQEIARKAATAPTGKFAVAGGIKKSAERLSLEQQIAKLQKRTPGLLAEWKKEWAANPNTKEARDAAKAYQANRAEIAKLLAERAHEVRKSVEAGEKAEAEAPPPTPNTVWSEAYQTPTGEVIVGQLKPGGYWGLVKFKSMADFPEKGTAAYGVAGERSGVGKMVRQFFPEAKVVELPAEFRGRTQSIVQEQAGEEIGGEFVAGNTIRKESQDLAEAGNYPEAWDRAQDMMPGAEKDAQLVWLAAFQKAAEAAARAIRKKEGGGAAAKKKG